MMFLLGPVMIAAGRIVPRGGSQTEGIRSQSHHGSERSFDESQREGDHSERRRIGASEALLHNRG